MIDVYCFITSYLLTDESGISLWVNGCMIYSAIISCREKWIFHFESTLQYLQGIHSKVQYSIHIYNTIVILMRYNNFNRYFASLANRHQMRARQNRVINYVMYVLSQYFLISYMCSLFLLINSKLLYDYNAYVEICDLAASIS